MKLILFYIYYFIDSQSALVHCGRCRTHFHSSCVSSPSSRSPSSRSRSPVNGSTDRRYRRSEVICPECGDEVKEKTSNWTVIPRGFSLQNGNMDDRYKGNLNILLYLYLLIARI